MMHFTQWRAFVGYNDEIWILRVKSQKGTSAFLRAIYKSHNKSGKLAAPNQMENIWNATAFLYLLLDLHKMWYLQACGHH